MNSKPNINTLMLQHPRNITDRILCLRYCHAIPDNNNHTFSSSERVGYFVDIGFRYRAFDFVVAVVGWWDPAEENVGYSSVHGRAHYVGEDGAGYTD